MNEGIVRKIGRRKGVSPVIATILMVAITVVLAAVLIVYMQTIAAPDEKPPAEWHAEVKQSLYGAQTNWSIMITSAPSGGVAFDSMSYQLERASDMKLSQAFGLQPSLGFNITDNSQSGTANNRLEQGDVLFVDSSFPNGFAAHGNKFILLKDNKKLLEITLP